MTPTRVFMSSAMYREMLVFSMLEKMPLAEAERIADERMVEWEQENEARAVADNEGFMRMLDLVFTDVGKP